MNQEKNTKLIIGLVISIIILIIVIAVGTYSFYSANINTTNNDQNKLQNSTATLEFVLTDGTLTGDNLIPGDTITKTFQVKNNGTIDGTFKIVWSEVTNNFVNKQDLIVTLSDEEGEIISESDNQVLPDSTTTATLIKDKLNISAGATKNYTLKITYRNTEEDQSSDMGKSLSAKIKLEN